MNSPLFCDEKLCFKAFAELTVDNLLIAVDCLPSDLLLDVVDCMSQELVDCICSDLRFRNIRQAREERKELERQEHHYLMTMDYDLVMEDARTIDPPMLSNIWTNENAFFQSSENARSAL